MRYYNDIAGWYFGPDGEPKGTTIGMKNQQLNDRADDRVPFLGVKRRWVGYALFLFVISLLVYMGFSAADYLSTDGWRGFKTVRAIFHDTSQSLPILGVAPIVILVIWEFLMIVYEIVKEQIEARQRSRIAAHEARGEERGIKLGEERGEERGIKLGEERGKELERDAWLDWLERRQAAEAAGEPFTEPNPAEQHNGTSPPTA